MGTVGVGGAGEYCGSGGYCGCGRGRWVLWVWAGQVSTVGQVGTVTQVQTVSEQNTHNNSPMRQ